MSAAGLPPRRELDKRNVDVAMTKDGPYVIEVNDFPTYWGIPEAGALIAQHTLTRIQSDVIPEGQRGRHPCALLLARSRSGSGSPPL
jgi:hypothetical protein